MMAVDKLKTTTSALLIVLDCGRYPASAMHVKKLSIARARQYNDISIRLLFFSIANPRPVGNCKKMQSSTLQKKCYRIILIVDAISNILFPWPPLECYIF
jgi:hypothetical protein